MKKMLVYLLLLFLRCFVLVSCKILFRLRVHGIENLPQKTGAIVVINHGSYLDFLIAACVLPRKFSFIINSHVFYKKGLHWLFKAANCIPVGSGLDLEARNKFNVLVKEQVSKGLYVCLFAEGTVTRTGQILEFKKGIEHLASITGAPVIPMHFDNVVGSVYSWMPGSGKLVGFRLKGLRRPVNVSIGNVLPVPVTAFQLRQRVKELEVENFKRRFKPSDNVYTAVIRKINGESHSYWNDGDARIDYKDLLFSISTLSQSLSKEVENDNVIGIMLPVGISSMQLNLFMMLKKKTTVNIDPSYSNEERLYVCNTSGVRTLITTKNLRFTRFSPVTERVIYIEDLEDAARNGKQVKPCLASFTSAGRQFRSWFKTSNELDRVVTIFFEKDLKGELKGIPLTNLNLIAVLAGIRQSHFFESSAIVCSELPLYHSFGYVFQLLMPLYFDISWEKFFPIGDAHESGRRIFVLNADQLKKIVSAEGATTLKDNDRIFTSGITSDQDAIQKIADEGFPVFTCGGLNETSALFSINLNNFKGTDIEGKNLEHEAGNQYSIGKALPGVSVKICSEKNDDLELMPEEEGGVWVSGASIYSGALSPSENGSIEFHKGWYNTGLKGYMDTKGFIYLIHS